MNRKNYIFLSIGILIVFGLTSICVYLFYKQMRFEKVLYALQEESKPVLTVEPPILEKVITKAQLWRPIQEKIKDSVVQVFSQVALTDILQPYAPPTVGAATGSGFFINEQGELITNAHVVDQAKGLWIQIPSLGKRIIDVEVIGVSPDRDLALLRVTEKSLAIIRKELGSVPFLPLGDSDVIRRSDEVMALGYPLSQQSLKSTTGVVSGREQHYIQISAAINPGNSGGPLLNMKGEVIGINSAGVTEAQNVGYAIPVNDLKIVLSDLHTIKLLRKPYLGILYNNGTEPLTQYLGNPEPGGCYVAEVLKGSPLDKAGVKSGDMVYEINGNQVDLFGEVTVPWSEDKITLTDFVGRLPVGANVQIIAYRKGERKGFDFMLSQVELPAIRKIYPGYESIDYEAFAGMVVMELTLNHVGIMASRISGLVKYGESRYQTEPVLIVTHIFPNSQLYRSRVPLLGSTINEVNGLKVKTLKEYRAALKKGISQPFLTVRASDNLTRASDNVLTALDMDKIVEEELRLSQDYKYPLSQTAQSILQIKKAEQAIIQAQ